MRTESSVELIRRIISLLLTSPGTIAKQPPLISARAPSSISKRRFVVLLALSGPWQAKHRSERIGRMSRLNSTTDAFSSEVAPDERIVQPNIPQMSRRLDRREH